MIATKTNLEITEYREKFFLGLSLRQLACFAAAAMLAIATCFVCLHWLRMDILASSVLYELIGPACAKLSLYLSGSYSNRLDDIVTETVKCDGHEPENEVERLIRQIQAIQKELPAHNDPFLEDEQAYDEAAYEHYALTGYPQVSYQNTRRKADIWTL